jgi:uncharacterized peroxidase-related enzyme
VAFINTTPPAAAEDEVLEMYQRQQGAWGFVPDYAKVFCYRPEVMVRWAKLLAEIRRPLDPRRFELVTFAAAHELRHSSCSLAHGKQLTEFFDNEDVRNLAEGRPVEALTDAEREIVKFSRKMARDASSVTQADVTALKNQGLSDADVFDVAATAAGRAFLTKLLDALGSEPDSSFLAMDSELRDTLTVGRPINTAAVEALPGGE